MLTLIPIARRSVRAALSLSLLAVSLLPAAKPVWADVAFTVDSPLDEPDAAPGDGACFSTPSGLCTLRAAIQETNTLAGADTIHLPSGTYLLTRVGGDDTAGDLDILDNVTITGADAGTTVIDGNFDVTQDRVFQIDPGVSAAMITGVAITNGGQNEGGGIYNSGTLTLTNSVVTDNLATVGGGLFNFDSGNAALVNSTVSDNDSVLGGGGILNGGRLTLTGSTLSGNFTAFDGGGIKNSGELNITSSNVVSNTAQNVPGRRGGGIYSESLLTLTITNSTVVSNTAFVGGGIYNVGALVLDNSALSGNTAQGGAGLYQDGGSATLTGSTLSGNTAQAGDGGGLYNAGGIVPVTGSLVSGNVAHLSGGGLYNTGTLTLTDSTVSGNTANGPGGGGLYNANSLSLTTSTVSGNTAQGGNGGGLYNSSGTLVLTNSSLSGNFADLSGGGLYHAGGTANLYNVTVAENIADANNNDASNGGGLRHLGGTLSFRNTLIANNYHVDSLPAPTLVPDDCKGTPTSEGYNLIQDITNCLIGGFATGNITGQPAQIGPLQNNGGPTQTHALAPGSPALDAGNPVGCRDGLNNVLVTDQRGGPRHADGDFSAGSRCDIGAFELLGSVFLPLVVK